MAGPGTASEAIFVPADRPRRHPGTEIPEISNRDFLHESAIATDLYVVARLFALRSPFQRSGTVGEFFHAMREINRIKERERDWAAQ